ncbi:secretin N-terminal domain-containing protein [Candidatus Riflebacteria bacterium]
MSFTPVKQAERVIRQLYPGNQVTVTSVPDRNILLIRAIPGLMQAITKVIKQLDKAPASFIVTLSRPMTEKSKSQRLGIENLNMQRQKSGKRTVIGDIIARRRSSDRKSQSKQSLRVLSGQTAYFFLGQQRFFQMNRFQKPAVQNIGKTMCVSVFELSNNMVRLEIEIDYSRPSSGLTIQSSALRTTMIVPLGVPRRLGGMDNRNQGNDSNFQVDKGLDLTGNNQDIFTNEEFIITVHKAL